MTDTHAIEALLAPSLEGLGFRLVRVTFGSGSRPVLQVMAEPLDGSPMTVEHCADVSRAVSALLDVSDPIGQAYLLEVSSPGIDRPLVAPQDFARFRGFEARIELSQPVDGRKRFKGRLDGIDEEQRIGLIDEVGRVLIPFPAIMKAKLLLTDELIAASLAARPPAAGTA